MTSHAARLCNACTRLDKSEASLGYRRWPRCTAYPEGIPADILAGGSHVLPRGDEVNGFTFNPDPERRDIYSAWASTQEVLPT